MRATRIILLVKYRPCLSPGGGTTGTELSVGLWDAAVHSNTGGCNGGMILRGAVHAGMLAGTPVGWGGAIFYWSRGLLSCLRVCENGPTPAGGECLCWGHSTDGTESTRSKHHTAHSTQHNTRQHHTNIMKGVVAKKNARPRNRARCPTLHIWLLWRPARHPRRSKFVINHI